MASPEEFDLEVVRSAPPHARSGSAGPRAWRDSLRRGWRAPASWVLLGAVLVGTGVVVADGPPPPWQPGIVSGIETPQPAWTVSTRASASADHRIDPSLYLTEEMVIVRSDEAIEGFSVADGSQVWSVPAQHPRCPPPESTGAMLCTSGHGEGAELLRLDTSTGLEARENIPGLVAAGTDGETTFTMRVDTDGTAVLQRNGSWSTWVDDEAHWMHQATGASLIVAGEHLLAMVVSDNHWYWQTLNADDGGPSSLGADSLFEGTTGGTTWLVHELEHGQWSYLSTDGSSSRPMSEPPPFIVDDDPESPVVINPHVRGELRAQTEHGEVLWHREGEEEPLARFQDTIVVSESRELIGVDRDTGTTLWRKPTQIPHEYWQANGWMLSDTTTLAFIQPTPTGYQLTGIDLATGSEQFRLTPEDAADNSEATEADHASAPHTVAVSASHVAVATEQDVTLWSLSGHAGGT